MKGSGTHGVYNIGTGYRPMGFSEFGHSGSTHTARIFNLSWMILSLVNITYLNVQSMRVAAENVSIYRKGILLIEESVKVSEF